MLIEPLRAVHATDYRALMLEAYALHPGDHALEAGRSDCIAGFHSCTGQHLHLPVRLGGRDHGDESWPGNGIDPVMSGRS